jgi:hypothetical protein
MEIINCGIRYLQTRVSVAIVEVPGATYQSYGELNDRKSRSAVAMLVRCINARPM